jgi:hypothetical protein
MPEIQADHVPQVGLQDRLVPARRRRGELAGTTDIDLAIDRLVGPVYYRILLARQSVPVAFTDALVQRYPAETVDR